MIVNFHRLQVDKHPQVLRLKLSCSISSRLEPVKSILGILQANDFLISEIPVFPFNSTLYRWSLYSKESFEVQILNLVEQWS